MLEEAVRGLDGFWVMVLYVGPWILIFNQNSLHACENLYQLMRLSCSAEPPARSMFLISTWRILVFYLKHATLNSYPTDLVVSIIPYRASSNAHESIIEVNIRRGRCDADYPRWHAVITDCAHHVAVITMSSWEGILFSLAEAIHFMLTKSNAFMISMKQFADLA